MWLVAMSDRGSWRDALDDKSIVTIGMLLLAVIVGGIFQQAVNASFILEDNEKSTVTRGAVFHRKPMP